MLIGSPIGAVFRGSACQLQKRNPAQDKRTSKTGCNILMTGSMVLVTPAKAYYPGVSGAADKVRERSAIPLTWSCSVVQCMRKAKPYFSRHFEQHLAVR